MDFSFVTKRLPSWFGEPEKFLVLGAANMVSHGLVFAGKIWKGCPAFLSRGGQAYVRVSPLFYIYHSTNELDDRAQLARRSYSVGNLEAATYNGLGCFVCVVDIIIIVGYALASLLPQEMEKQLYERLKPISNVVLVLILIQTLWKHSFTLRTIDQLKASEENKNDPLNIAVISLVSPFLRPELNKYKAADWNTLSETINWDSVQASLKNEADETATRFNRQRSLFISKRFPDSTLLATVNFSVHSYFFKANVQYLLKERKYARYFVLHAKRCPARLLQQSLQRAKPLFRRILN